MRRWRRYRELSPKERCLLRWAWFFLPIHALAVACLGLRRWQALLARLAPFEPERATSDDLARAQRTSQLVEMAVRNSLYHPNCLQRSLTLWWLLRREGLESQICFGAKREANVFKAHAWVEYQGVVLNDSPAISQEYAPLRNAL